MLWALQVWSHLLPSQVSGDRNLKPIRKKTICIDWSFFNWLNQPCDVYLCRVEFRTGGQFLLCQNLHVVIIWLQDPQDVKQFIFVQMIKVYSGCNNFITWNMKQLFKTNRFLSFPLIIYLQTLLNWSKHSKDSTSFNNYFTLIQFYLYVTKS